MKKILLSLLSFLVGVVIFMPKEQLYYSALRYLQKERLSIKADAVRDRLFWLEIKDAKIYYDGIESIDAKEIKIKPWLFYNSVVIEEAKSADELRGVMELNAKSVELTHSLLNYKSLFLRADGSFGKASGKIDLFARDINITLQPSNSFKESQLSGYFKKSKEGWRYDTKF